MRVNKLLLAACVAGGLSVSSLVQSVSGEVYQAALGATAQELGIKQAKTVDIDTLQQVSNLRQNCLGICIAPLHAADGVTTIDELDVMRFIDSFAQHGTGLLIDAREQGERDIAYLPMSVNVPHFVVTDDNPRLNDILVIMGARSFAGALNFADAKQLVIFDGGPATQDAPSLIKALIAKGYPEDKIKYYRGGVQVWAALGLNVEGTL